VVTKHALVDVLAAEQRARPSVNAVQTLMSRLRQALPHAPIETVSGGYVLRVGPDELDVLRFEQDASVALAAARMQAWGRARDLATRALEAWHGEPLREFAGEEFVRGWSAHLVEVQSQITECNIEARLALGDHRRVVAELTRLVDDHPYREQSWAFLMLALYRCGRQSEALHACHRLRDLLIEDLGVSPGPEIARLEIAILNQDRSLDWRPPASSSTSPVFGATPGTVTGALIGRDQLVTDVAGALGRHRLVTLIGTGGVGKTSVARAVAEGSQGVGFPDGFRFVELASLTAGDAVADAILGALHGQRAAGESDEEAVVRVLHAVTALLVIDNCEHVLAAVRELVERVLADCPNVRILATSREPVGLPGEHSIAIPPLAAPERGLVAVDELERCTAVRLFVERAKVVDEAFALTSENAGAVAEITRYLGEIPLSLELAAARLDVELIGELQPSQAVPLSRRLTGPARASERTGSVWGSLRWSVDLLEPDDQAVFRAVSFFAGPFTREMARQICPEPEAFDASFDRVVRASLLGREAAIDNRFRMLEPVKEYARSCINGSELEELSERHRVLMMARAHLLNRDLMGAGEKQACDTMRADLPDYRALMTRLVDSGATEPAATLLVDLFQFCHFQMVPEGNQWARDLAWLLDDDSPLAAEIHGAAALGAWFEGDMDLAIRLGERAVEVANGSAVPAPMWARLALVNTLGYAGRMDELRVHFRALIADSRASTEPFWRINGLGYEAIGRLVIGDVTTAMQKAEDALQQARRLQNPDCLHWALHCLGRVLVASGDLPGAAAAFQEAIAVTNEVRSRWNLALDLLEWARAEHRLGNDAVAAQAMYELLGLIRESGNRSQLAAALNDLARILARLGDLHTAAFALLARTGMPDLRLAAGVGSFSDLDGDDALLAKFAGSLPQADLARIRARARGSPDHRVIATCRSAVGRALGLDEMCVIHQPAGRMPTRG
jgi:predicted ATPase/DNA-binding SARP family transcriptional activator/tetratricopeptide (TPR) repeat protein